MSTVVGLYLIGTLAAALVAILVNYIFPLKLTLANVAESDLSRYKKG
ncbi:Serine/threonine transporter SstT [Streptococcus pasteurianus]|nr:Serine/threonine transporter SstT [Streptococcus pasteurianus]